MKENKAPLLVRLLRKELAEGNYPEGSRFPSEIDLANRFEINKTTANRIVSALVAEGLLIRGVRGSGTYVVKEEAFPKGQIAFIAPLGHYHVCSMLRGASDYALTRKYVVTPVTPSSQTLNRHLKLLRNSPFKGILTSSYETVDAPDGIPVIHIDQDFPSNDRVHHAVNADNYNGARELMRKAIAAGHREIAIFQSDITNILGGKIISGYLDAMREAGIPHPEKRIFQCVEWSQLSFNVTLEQILRAYPDVSLIATESDNDVMQFRTAFHLVAPEKQDGIVLTGFGNVAEFVQHFEFPTVDMHFVRLGAIAAEKLISIMENGEPEEPVREYQPCELINTSALLCRRIV